MLGVMYGIGLWYGSTLVEKNSIRVGDMFGCYFSFIIAGMALGEAGSVATDLTNGTSSANQFYHIQQRNVEMKQADIDDPIVKKQPLKGEIEFRNVSFVYPTSPDKLVITNLSFKVRHGQTFAIVGPSGSGKSTIVSLLERYYDPKFGEIFVDGELIHNYDIHFLVLFSKKIFLTEEEGGDLKKNKHKIM
ncbi:ATP-binding cassette transporter, subfamily B, member 26, group MDR/PGP protein PpABCB26 [Reticulomyxa filosa]|uniref:ATP-binding cassette transporter, subfamily B, member 26, group MDR/PGP protein PpABCB26 n=1 Tax=Reticulomyxa filosa TaxID=46433 RepID=X6LCU1_RETFI|nr:ATP-binding cassette transporter, subfamily B, member 26, group MDR/PGP protein PpABCB26 [Reticulomyxa filosa]|eukprot:ETN98901.1 ATP-binding cassette transporter, subfamily B, member 26, group MDR/PGP protein PpABCB26 [Reticulomyxa filosa]